MNHAPRTDAARPHPTPSTGPAAEPATPGRAMPRRSARRGALLRCVAAALAVATPASALAEVVALTPLIPARGVSGKSQEAVFALMSGELEFMDGVEEVIEVNPAPPALTSSCLESTRCLDAIATGVQADRLIAGGMELLGDELALDLVWFDATANRVIRRKTFVVPEDVGGMIDVMTPLLVELLTGVSPTKQAEEDKMADVSFDDGEEDDGLVFGTEPAPAPAPRPAPSEGRTRSVGTAISAPPPPPPPPPPPEEEEEEFDPSLISFGTSAADITFASQDEEPLPPPPPPPPPPRDDPSWDEEEDFDAARATRVSGGKPPSSTAAPPSRGGSSPTKSTTSKAPSGADGFRRVHITTRGGWTNYSLFNFGTAGAELGVRVAGGLSIVVGLDAHIVTRQLPPDIAAQEGRSVSVDTIAPVNAGLLYRFRDQKIQPYAGVDAQFTWYWRNPETGRYSVAFGARARGGADFFVSRNFGFNLDLALGFWLGRDWPQVDPRLPAVAFLPHFGGGFVFAF